MAQPGPSAFLVLFGDNGIEYELAGYIADPQNGKLGVQSAMNRAIWRKFKEHGISIPYPQREVRVLGKVEFDGHGGLVKEVREAHIDLPGVPGGSAS